MNQEVIMKGSEIINLLDSKNIQRFQSDILWLLVKSVKYLNDTALNIFKCFTFKIIKHTY